MLVTAIASAITLPVDRCIQSQGYMKAGAALHARYGLALSRGRALRGAQVAPRRFVSVSVGVASLATLLMFTAPADPARALHIREPASGVTFPARRDVLGEPATAIGVGLRRAYWIVKVYAACLYVEEATGGPAFLDLVASSAGDMKVLRGDDARRVREWLVTGDFGRALESVFLRDVEKGRIAGAMRESLDRNLASHSPEIDSAADAIVAALDVPVRSGQRLLMAQLRGYTVELELGTHP